MVFYTPFGVSSREGYDCAPAEPEDALALPHRETGWILTAVAALAAFGSVYLFFKEDSTLMKAAALLGILSAPVLAMMPQIPRWGGFGAALSVLPVLFFCLWLVVFYKENAANPILWSYGMEILAIAMCLLAVFRLSAYLFYRAKPRRAIFACMLALITSLATLTDLDSGDEIFIALFLLPEGTDIGMTLHYENLSYEITEE